MLSPERFFYHMMRQNGVGHQEHVAKVSEHLIVYEKEVIECLWMIFEGILAENFKI